MEPRRTDGNPTELLQTLEEEPSIPALWLSQTSRSQALTTEVRCKTPGTSGAIAMIPSLDASFAAQPEVPVERIAEEALGEALRRLCRGGSWQGIARELAWRAVTGGHRDARSVESLAETAEAMLAPLVDQALWEVERHALETREEYLALRPGDEAGALAAARLDAAEEAARLSDEAYDRVLDSLLSLSRRAA
jgi:hypothetical protein